MIEILALQETIDSGRKRFPIYLAFMQAITINKIADVPSYKRETTHAEIARNISFTPVKEWQRMPIDKKLSQIRGLFNNSGQFMPNPILLGANPNLGDLIDIKPQTVDDRLTGAWLLTVKSNFRSEDKPLWILDGQHRIKGLADSKQKENPVPVVFLINKDAHVYAADVLARIFAQVTTLATPLGDLHQEWLSYAFNLKHYSNVNSKFQAHKDAMKTVIELCRASSLDDNYNEYYNHVKFLDDSQLSKTPKGGHAYSCIELKELIFKFYYDAPKAHGISVLSPEDLAKEMCIARDALGRVIQNRSRSVFFGDDQSHQKIMEDAYWIGVLRYIANHNKTENWESVLKNLCFDSTNWEFSWTRNLEGHAGTRSKKLASDVMSNIFVNLKLPDGNESIADLLKGNRASFDLCAYTTSPSGHRRRNPEKISTFYRGDGITFNIKNAKVLVLKNVSMNIQRICVTDLGVARGMDAPNIFSNKGTLKLDSNIYSKPLELLFTMSHYGDVESTAEITIDWQT